MAKIDVDHAELEKAAKSVDQYVDFMKKGMLKMTGSIEELDRTWQGADSIQLKKEWSELEAKDSTSSKMAIALANYADSLRTAASMYKKAQADAVNRANRLF